MINILSTAAKGLGTKMLPMEVQTLQEIENAFAEMARQKARAVFVSADPLFSSNQLRIAELAIRNRLPSMTTQRRYVEAGALVSYGANFSALYHDAAVYVDRIFKGAKPGDLPVEQPKVFELVINMKTAKAIGLKVPQSLMARADELIQ
jgi:putative ABC transport system substrate-binding protein